MWDEHWASIVVIEISVDNVTIIRGTFFDTCGALKRILEHQSQDHYSLVGKEKFSLISLCVIMKFYFLCIYGINRMEYHDECCLDRQIDIDIYNFMVITTEK